MENYFSCSSHSRTQSSAFTLIELLTVIAIVGVLAAILMPVVGRVRDSAHKAACLSNLRHIGVALKLQINDTKGRFPSRGDSWLNYGQVADALLPFLDGDVDAFVCPAHSVEDTYFRLEIPSKPGNYTNYEFNGTLANYVMSEERKATNRGTAGIFNPSMAAFAYDRPYVTREGQDPRLQPHPGGANVVYVDGSARWLPEEEMGLEAGSTPFYARGHDYLWR